MTGGDSPQFPHTLTFVIHLLEQDNKWVDIIFLAQLPSPNLCKPHHHHPHSLNKTE